MPGRGYIRVPLVHNGGTHPWYLPPVSFFPSWMRDFLPALRWASSVQSSSLEFGPCAVLAPAGGVPSTLRTLSCTSVHIAMYLFVKMADQHGEWAKIQEIAFYHITGKVRKEAQDLALRGVGSRSRCTVW